MATTCDKDSVRQAYELVRDDKSEVNWAVLKYDGNKIMVASTGSDYQEFLSNFSNSERLFGYLRMYTGDELSRRAKFALVTWIGSEVGAIKRAKVSIDKALVKDVISNFAVELATSDLADLEEESIKELLIKAGGANYGNGTAKNN
ncbi:coactosin [Brachionus plicatilis]|uniref:Coactosin-like protein n=1 Tax=Brachionus plicatilis TaxID=10195 RepID=A0A3M7R229_BRAPC|nr:coactosin [Brachionus plicatilis]